MRFRKSAVFLVIASTMGIGGASSSAGAIRPCHRVTNYEPSKVSALWLRQVTFADPDIRSRISTTIADSDAAQRVNPSVLSAVRTLRTGTGDALIYKDFFAGWPEISDSSNLTQITVFSGQPLADKGTLIVNGESPNVIVYYTVGMPGANDFRIGYATSGIIKYTSTENTEDATNIFFTAIQKHGIHADISLDISFRDLSVERASDVTECTFDASIVFEPSSLEMLSQ